MAQKTLDLDAELALGVSQARHRYIGEAIGRLQGGSKGAATLEHARSITAKYFKPGKLGEGLRAMRDDD